MSSDAVSNAVEGNSLQSWAFPLARIQHAPFSAIKDIHSYNCIPGVSTERGPIDDYELDAINLFGMAEPKSSVSLESVQFPPCFLVSEHDFHFRNCSGGNLLDSCSIHFTSGSNVLPDVDLKLLPADPYSPTCRLGISIDSNEVLPRPLSMPSLASDIIIEGRCAQPERPKGRGGRTSAKDPRLDPSIDPKRAKRILANRQSAARSKHKQRGHLDNLIGAQSLLDQQKGLILNEIAWLRADVRSLEEEGFKLEVQIFVLSEHLRLQEALQIKLLDGCCQNL